ncbi:putative inner membrane protein translocase component YidC [Streptomyces sp. Tu6071]|nr:putative inner membrane protein translocase component YidC [Streptomyces sp. Tu6071]
MKGKGGQGAGDTRRNPAPPEVRRGRTRGLRGRGDPGPGAPAARDASGTDVPDAPVPAGSGGQDDDEPLRFLALGLAAEPRRLDRVVHDLALEGRHGTQPDRLAAALRVGGGLGPQLAQLLALLRPVARDVQHQPTAVTGLPVHGEPGQLLESLQDLAVTTDELLEVPATVADDGDRGTIGLDVHVDVTVEVGDVEQTFEVVRGDLAFLLQTAERVATVGGLLGSGGGSAFRHGLDSFLLLGGRVLGTLRATLALTLLGLGAGRTGFAAPRGLRGAGAATRVLAGALLLRGVAALGLGPGGAGAALARTGGVRVRTGRRAADSGGAGLTLRLRLPLRLLTPLRGGATGGLVAVKGRDVALALHDGAVGLGREAGLAQSVDELPLGLVALPALRDDRLDRGAVPLGADLAGVREVLELTLQVGGLGLRTGGRVLADDEHLLAHGPHVGGQPVEEDTDGEVDAEDGEHDREDVHQHLLLLHERGLHRGVDVLRHQLALREELRGRHHDDHARGDDAHRGEVGTERVGAARELRGEGSTEDVRLLGGVEELVVDDADLLVRRDAVEHVVQREEERGLHEDGKARGERVGTRLLVQLHHLFALPLLVALVALLDALHLGLQRLHRTGRLDLLHEERDQADPDDDHEGHDGQAPGPAGVRAEDPSVQRVELHDHPGDGCRDETEPTGNRVH